MKQNTDYFRKRKANDPLFRLKCNFRANLARSFQRRDKLKYFKSEEILGCSIVEFIKYIENKFEAGMTLENHGEWHFDHIIPISTAKTEEEVIKLSHYTNFQPLWAKDNLTKSNK